MRSSPGVLAGSRRKANPLASTAASIEELARVKFAIDEHIKLFSRKSPLQVAWEPAIGS